MKTKEDFLKRVQSYSPEELRGALYGYSVELDKVTKDRVHLATENQDLRVELKNQQEAIVNLQLELETCKVEKDKLEGLYNAVAKELECFRSSEEELKTTIKTLIKLI
jgi:chromosome segregation ATPase